MTAALIKVVILALLFAANFYLAGQWLVYPKLRRRLRVCKPYLAIGWVLYIAGGSVLEPMGRMQGAVGLQAVGGLIAFIGLGLIVYAAARLLRANAAERRAARAMAAVPVSDGETWPPPPRLPVD